MKWLQDNPLGMALGALCGLLLLVLLVLTILSSLPLSVAPADNAAGATDKGLDLPTLAGNPPLDSYNVITQRPLFNETRLPILDEVVEDDEPPPENESDREVPQFELAGVIITPSLRMVTLKRTDKGKEQSLVAFEGKPIEADIGSWQVSSILPRAATLTSAGGQELQLEMKVHDAKIEPPPPVRPAAKEQTNGENASAAAAEDTAVEPLSRADEIRQRIAERREELRRDAEQSQQPEEKPRSPSYQQAIQSMIGRNRKPKSGNEDQQ